MSEQSYDVIVIGSGPGGEGAAMKAAKEGKNVAMVDKDLRVGGACTHRGTIPSKALRFAIAQMVDTNDSPIFKEQRLNIRLTFSQLRRTAEGVIDRQVNMRRSFYERNDIDIYSGHGRFVDPHRLEVDLRNGMTEILTADSFVIATGSRPYRPDNLDFTLPGVYDSDTILSLDKTPKSITIYGAGVIGCEYASMFRRLKCKVNLVNTRLKLLEFLDDEIIDALAYHLRDRGVLIRHQESFDHIESDGKNVVVFLKSGKQLRTDVLLWAQGRTGNSDKLGLETIDIVPNSRGHIPVNENYQTSHPHIYAVGDVVGYPSLASAAYDQGRFAATHLVTGECEYHLVQQIPTGIYTSPEISSVGPTERELTEAKVPYEVGHSYFKSIARAQITGKTTGMLKLLFHRDTLEILAIHCFGYNASEIIHIGQAIMSQDPPDNTLMYFINTTFNYPTMAEAYRVAALNGYNRVR
ncbi:Pyridine nucleotide-disulfide oxidoreductase dimerization region [Planctomycetales bacterium 10988]|nr:Pyridine nucleotide-disulfide oxidoreductase dimerization region [Planctomycetales bacterium 10988]